MKPLLCSRHRPEGWVYSNQYKKYGAEKINQQMNKMYTTAKGDRDGESKTMSAI